MSYARCSGLEGSTGSTRNLEYQGKKSIIFHFPVLGFLSSNFIVYTLSLLIYLNFSAATYLLGREKL